MESADNRIYAFSTISFLRYSLPLNTYCIDKNLESICDQNFNDIIEFHYPAFADCRKVPL